MRTVQGEVTACVQDPVAEEAQQGQENERAVRSREALEG